MSFFENIKILDIRVDKVTKKRALGEFERLLDTDGCSLIVTLNAEMVEKASRDSQLARIINTADMVIPDGVGLLYASKIKGDPIEEKVAGVEFAESAIEVCAGKDRKVFLLGGKPGIAHLAAEKLCEKYPGLLIAGTRDGYFKPEEEDDIVRQINESGADFLCVGMGFPRQELFIDRRRKELGVKVAVGVGGSFDIWSGTLKRAPQFFLDNGLEWLYRMVQEPWRFKRIPALSLFLIKAALRR